MIFSYKRSQEGTSVKCLQRHKLSPQSFSSEKGLKSESNLPRTLLPKKLNLLDLLDVDHNLDAIEFALS